jgi:hypothetical protein
MQLCVIKTHGFAILSDDRQDIPGSHFIINNQARIMISSPLTGVVI